MREHEGRWHDDDEELLDVLAEALRPPGPTVEDVRAAGRSVWPGGEGAAPDDRDRASPPG